MPWELDPEFIEEQQRAAHHQPGDHQPVVRRWLLLGLVLGTLLGSAGMLIVIQLMSLQTSRPAHTFQAMVRSSEATFIFPVPEQQPWEWYLPTTNANLLEYGWTVTLPATGPSYYEVGFNLVKIAGYTRRTGPLANLLRAGQAIVRQRDAERGTGRQVYDTQVVIVPREQQLVITVRDQAIITQMFATRPPQATFHIQMPYEARAVYSVPVIYLEDRWQPAR